MTSAAAAHGGRPDPEDPRLAELVGEWALQDSGFRRWWGTHRAAPRRSDTKVLNHPVVGPLTLDWSFLISTGDPDQ